VVVLEQLRYVRLVANELGRAADFAQRVLGLEPIERTPELATFRSDFRDHTLAFATGEHAVQSVGLEVRSPHELDAAAEGLGRVGVVVDRGSADDCALRKVKDMLWFTDCSGNRIELVVRPLNSGWRYFPSRDVGITGLSDVMIRSVDIDKDLSIWCDVLGAQISDWAGDAAYLRFDDAHHRIVLFPGVQGGILTVEYAVENVDLLMRNYYALRELQVGILHGPGRRPAGLGAAVPDLRRAHGGSLRLRRRRRGGNGETPAAAVSRRRGGTLQLGKRMQDRRVRRLLGA
jgi:2,3-dihydroxy-p-cumate/2,3-dihydroxybenzoate 3,4-dioxygenase